MATDPDIEDALLTARLKRLVRTWTRHQARSAAPYEPAVGAPPRWDVVVTRGGEIGARLLAWMRQASLGQPGPVVADPAADTLHWLVPAGTTALWCSPHAVCARADEERMPTPGRWAAGGARYWEYPPAGDRLVDPQLLAIGLAAVCGPVMGGRRPPAPLMRERTREREPRPSTPRPWQMPGRG
ncbi:hypothetical protein GCM10012280_13810 [Wenjunlia tyrosinilytica]|uniref:Uncharacterized protein n=1 Tax=Wenjunlia tyrosinilytica TaxID=1544741 RepID=A0A918DV91_9ACTN|nr:hypothetical protein GCM10012280_13810 [Wenjunlia tyrosinilytica]